MPTSSLRVRTKKPPAGSWKLWARTARSVGARATTPIFCARAFAICSPPGWEDRLVPLADCAGVFCLEPHDYAVAKLRAGRPKDLALLTALLATGRLAAGTVRERLDRTQMPEAAVAAKLPAPGRSHRRRAPPARGMAAAGPGLTRRARSSGGYRGGCRGAPINVVVVLTPSAGRDPLRRVCVLRKRYLPRSFPHGGPDGAGPSRRFRHFANRGKRPRNVGITTEGYFLTPPPGLPTASSGFTWF